MNLSEYVGSNFFAYTEGTYKVSASDRRKIVASVDSVILVALGYKVRLNVTGSGLVNVLYSDGIKRVLQSEEGTFICNNKSYT